MEAKEKTGRYLAGGHHAARCPGKWMTVAVLLVWDGLLIYMIVRCLIEPVYGAAFVAAVSFYLGILL